MIRVPKGYKHFSADQHKHQLFEFLTTIEVKDTKIFTHQELQQIRLRRFMIEARLRKHSIKSREIQDYVNYVFNFGLSEKEKPNFAKMAYGGHF